MDLTEEKDDIVITPKEAEIVLDTPKKKSKRMFQTDEELRKYKAETLRRGREKQRQNKAETKRKLKELEEIRKQENHFSSYVINPLMTEFGKMSQQINELKAELSSLREARPKQKEVKFEEPPKRTKSVNSRMKLNIPSFK